VKIDPGFALAYAWQAFCYTYLGATGQISAKKAFPVARRLTEKAFELQGAIAEAHLASGLIAMFYDWNWDQAGRSIRKALEISPGWAVGHHLYALYLSIMGRQEEAVTAMELAHSLDPMSSIMNYALGETYFCARRFHDALSQYQHTLDVNPNFRAAKNGLGYVLAEMGEFEKATNILKQVREEIGDELKGWTELGYVYAKSGRKQDAEECVRKLLLRQERDPDADLSIDLAVVYLGLGDFDNVFRYLNEAVDRRYGGVLFVKSNPGWDSLHSDPRFALLLQRIGM
jgi:tetratricopeptide (TPR) repeat protein